MDGILPMDDPDPVISVRYNESVTGYWVLLVVFTCLLCAARLLHKIYPVMSVKAWILMAVLVSIIFNGLYRGKLYGSYDFLSEVEPLSSELKDTEPVKNKSLTDVSCQISAFYMAVRRCYLDGHMPYWYPYNAAGYSLWGNPQAMAAHPLTLLSLVVPERYGMSFMAAMRLGVTFLLMFFLSKIWGFRDRTGYITASGWALATHNVAFLFFPIMNVVFLLPGAVAALHLLRDRGKIRDHLFFIALLSLMSIGGHPASFFHVLVFLSFYIVFVFMSVRFALRCLACLILALFIAAPVLYPQKRAIDQSFRKRVVEVRNEVRPNLRECVTDYPVLPRLGKMVTLAFPGFFEHPRWTSEHPDPKVDYYKQDICSAGTILFILFLGGVTLWRKLPGHLKFLVGFSPFVIMASYRLPLLGDLIDRLPVFNHVINQRMRYLFIFIVISVAGYLLSHQSEFEKGLRRGLALFGIPLAAALAAWAFGVILHPLAVMAPVLVCCITILVQRWNALPGATVLLLVVGELLPHVYDFNPACKPGMFFPETPSLKIASSAEGRMAAVNWVCQANINMPYGIRSILENDPLSPARYAKFLRDGIGYETTPYFHKFEMNVRCLRMFEFLNVSTLLAKYQMKVYPSFPEPFGNVYLHEVPNSCGLFFAPATFAECRTWEEFWSVWKQGKSVRDIVAVKKHPPEIKEGDRLARPDIAWIETSPHRFQLEVESDGWCLVASSLWQDYNWTVRDEQGRLIPDVWVYDMFVGFFLPPGHHHLIVKYTPYHLLEGMGYMVGGISILFIWMLWHRRREDVGQESHPAPFAG